ncbi:M48 family metallopeptidase [Xenophilus arseniciresistens]|uniref:M48 family metallopeptidase n=1 Tax=Xenophilus arseniciresistens TaxID=1283306 RepID=A0AAE3NCV8_9BURK|nr:M48 family metallopeptidase [Xenophilus arseniciresistens]MDA7417927.1 M48 family metallopeptidase [Xenophilus arseniciresistens]
MDRADFVHLVHLSEQASAENSQAYRRGVAAFAALGYAWVLGCLLLALAGLGWVFGLWSDEPVRWHAVRVMVLLSSLGLAWATLRSLWLQQEPPEGVALTPEQAPALFEALARIREKIQGPPIHQVYLDDAFNASIRQWPRFGLLGGAVNTLTIGLPLLMALERRRLLSVLAHEYGHLRGDHGRLNAWVYRTRLAWLRMDAHMQRQDGAMAQLSQAFLHWYFPRFAARTFALARQDEYEADRVSAKLLGPRVAASALSEIAIKAQWLDAQLMPAHWARAADRAQPLGPFAALQTQLCSAPPEDVARAALRAALRGTSDVSDTHPGLRDRLEAWEVSPRLPRWPEKGSLHMLADAAHWVRHFDAQWCRAQGADWRQHHAWLERVRERAALLAARADRLTADECVEWADLELRRNPQAVVRSRYERALELAPEHAGALRGLLRGECGRADRLALLDRLHATGAAQHYRAASEAVALLEDPAQGEHDAQALQRWRERLRAAREGEQRAWEELAEPPYFERTGSPTLDEFVLSELRIALARCRPVTRAWLLKRELRAMPWRAAHILFVQVHGLDDEQRHGLCRALEQQLDVPGALLVLAAGQDVPRDEVEQHVRAPVWTRTRLQG